MTKEQRKAWRLANPELHREEQRIHYARHSKEIRERCSAWKQANPEKRRAHTRTRYARDRACGAFTADEWFVLCFACGFRCLCCGEVKPLSPDHVVPVSRGGSSYLHNIQPLCLVCNQRKYTSTIDYRG